MDNKRIPYQYLSSYLLGKFRELGFLETWNNGNINTKSFTVKNKYDLNLVISFPGYKTKVQGKRITYDYRVSLNNVAISHVNIIVDLYNKALQLDHNSYILNDYLFDLAINGYNYNREKYLLLDSTMKPPSKDLLESIEKFHLKMGKRFGMKGNYNWNYSLDELTYVIMFIVLQEDINYPPHIPKLLGRKMPFDRYLESVYFAQHPNNGVFNLKDVIKRALDHKQPPAYNLEGLTYLSKDSLIS